MHHQGRGQLPPAPGHTQRLPSGAATELPPQHRVSTEGHLLALQVEPPTLATPLELTTPDSLNPSPVTTHEKTLHRRVSRGGRQPYLQAGEPPALTAPLEPTTSTTLKQPPMAPYEATALRR